MDRKNPPVAKPLVDLSNCDREPIHLLGHVQSYGCLMALTSDWIVAHTSENCPDILGLPWSDLLGMPLVEIFPPASIHDLRTRMQILNTGDDGARVFGFDLFHDGRLFDISIHSTQHLIVFEFEPKSTATRTRDDLSTVTPLIARVRRKTGIEAMATEAARGLKALSGFDRVMVYRFDEDGSGVVIGEALTPGVDSYLGLRFPASDVPKQARALYLRNRIRIIPDIAAPTYPVRPQSRPDGTPIDLSMAVTRAVSTIHLEYLRNMGVAGSMSVSIVCKKRLWGLFACHNETPHYIDFEKRSAVELFGQLFNYELAQVEMDAELSQSDLARDLHDRLMKRVSGGTTAIDALDEVSDEISEIIPHDGAVIVAKGEFRSRGSAPTREEFAVLARFLNTSQPTAIFSTDSIQERLPATEAFADRAAGVLALPISRMPRDYIVLFRREKVRSVTWAGNPEKSVGLGPNGIRLTPRKSFEAWKQQVSGYSDPWLDAELRAAEALRVTLLEVVLKLADEASAIQRRAKDRQDLLISELNHRVRNILNLIRGLVSQSQGTAESLESYSEILSSRIHALARAHDQLTETDWENVSLHELLSNEVSAFAPSDSTDRIAITGRDVCLTPSAFTTMALVIHEMMTNSVKYGALSAAEGRLAVDISIDAATGAAYLTWTESGGPAVRPPSRRGFGTTIIERSVPFELNGHARVDYNVGGLEAEFMLPADHVSDVRDVSTRTAAAKEAVTQARLSGEALVVEDNMIIALDASDMLTEMGASNVITVGNVAGALDVLKSRNVSFALIDVNLGSETSLPVALECERLGVMMVLATGYGDGGEITETYPAVPILRKPYGLQDISQAILALTSKSEG